MCIKGKKEKTSLTTLLSAYNVLDTNLELLISRRISRKVLSKKCVESETLFVTHFEHLGYPLMLEYKCHDSYCALLRLML